MQKKMFCVTQFVNCQLFYKIKLKSENDKFIIKMKETPKAIKKEMCNTNTNHFSLYDNVLIHSQSVVVSATLQKFLFNEFCIRHLEISRVKPLMRSYVYWPTIEHDSEKSVKSCRGCAFSAKSLPVEFQP